MLTQKKKNLCHAYQEKWVDIDNNRLCYNDPIWPFLDNGTTASDHMRDFSKFPISIRTGNLNARKGWRKDSQKKIWGEKTAARKSEEETFTFSLYGLSNNDFAAPRVIFHNMRAVQISRGLRKSDLILCVHNKYYNKVRV